MRIREKLRLRGTYVYPEVKIRLSGTIFLFNFILVAIFEGVTEKKKRSFSLLF